MPVPVVIVVVTQKAAVDVPVPVPVRVVRKVVPAASSGNDSHLCVCVLTFDKLRKQAVNKLISKSKTHVFFSQVVCLVFF